MTTKTLAMFALLLASTVQAQGPALTKADSQIDELLSEARSKALLLKSDVGTLDFFVLPEGSRNYARMLDLYIERAAEFRTLARRIVEARKDASRWRQFSADQVVPLMEEFASNAETSVKACRSISDPVRPEFRAYLKARSDLADELYKLICAWIDYGKTRDDIDGAAKAIDTSSSF